MTTTSIAIAIPDEDVAIPADVPEMTFEYISPQTAQKWLAKFNTQNRNMKNTHVVSLVSDMVSGNWLVTGDTIKFDKVGLLIDGQHRLKACVKSGEGFWTYVARGLNTAVRDVIDTNAPRLASDVLQFTGRTRTRTLASVARICMHREAGGYHFVGPNRGVEKLTNAQILSYIETHPEVEKMVHAPRPNIPTSQSGFMASSVWIYAMLEMSKIDPDLAKEFEEKILTGQYGEKGDPRWAFSQGLSVIRNNKHTQELSISQALYLIFTAWNDMRDGEKPMRGYSVVPFKSGPREVPEPH